MHSDTGSTSLQTNLGIAYIAYVPFITYISCIAYVYTYMAHKPYIYKRIAQTADTAYIGPFFRYLIFAYPS